ncbi:MAG TPA: carboxypeptidase regulatory-like domain-containing protein, partial [Candidatus Angelobacter sp.]|nr:carboxypeptidase regulatory-like domain-containing protein [Candidatus Angelobacter sp.]
MRSYSSPMFVMMVLGLVSAACGQEAPPAMPASQSAPPLQTASQPKPEATSAAAPYGEISGVVKSGNVLLPGVAVTAANTLTGKKYFTSTDLDGTFKISVTGKGRYVVKAEFSAFAPLTQEIVINDENRNGKAEMAMVLLSRAQKEAQQVAQQEQRQQAQQLASSGRGAAVQQLALSSSGADIGGGGAAGGTDAASLAGAGLPNAALGADGGNESVAISGAQGRAEQNIFDPGEMQDRMADLRDQARQGGGGILSMGGGGFGGGAGPMGVMMGGGGGGRGMRGFNANKAHGSIFYNYGGSGLDAKSYSLNGQPET